MAAGFVVSEEIPAPRGAVWEALLHGAVPATGAAPGAPPRELRVGSTRMGLEVVDPVDGVTGTAPWGGSPHQVSVHLVDRGGAGTLLVLTAEDTASPDPHRVALGGSGSPLVHRQVQRDLRELADDVRRRVMAAGAPPDQRSR